MLQRLEEGEKHDVKIASCPDLNTVLKLFSQFYERTTIEQAVNTSMDV